MTDPKLEAAARALLAEELFSAGLEAEAYEVESNAHRGDEFERYDRAAISAIVAALSQQRAVPEGYVLIGKPMLRGMIGDEAMAQIEAACVYPVAAAIAEGEQE